MLSSIIGVIIGVLGIVAGVFALLAEELDKNKKLKYGIVAALFAFTLYAMIGSLLSLNSASSPSMELSTPSVPIAVDSEREWQATGFQVDKGDTVRVQVVGGRWTTASGEMSSDIKSQLPDSIRGLQILIFYVYATGGEGTDTSCAEFGFYDCPVPTSPVGALVAKIGLAGQPFTIGKAETFTAPDSGMLYLRINDEQNVDDNAGILAVEIATQK